MWIALIIVAVLVIYGIANYNGLVGKQNKVKNQWSQIDVQLKRRFDLIPNLVEAVKGYAAHEKGTLNAVIEARTKYMAAGDNPSAAIEADNMLTKTLGKLFALSESYPDLKANQNFLSLQAELSNLEEKISFARQFYNDTAMEFNNAVQMFPSNIFAGIFGFKEATFFEIEQSNRETPQVKF